MKLINTWKYSSRMYATEPQIERCNMKYLLVLAVFAIAGCGGSSDDSAGSNMAEEAEDMMEAAGDKIEDVADDAADMMEDGADAAADMLEDGKEAASDAMHDAMDKAEDVGDVLMEEKENMDDALDEATAD
jgi:DUF917 family protein